MAISNANANGIPFIKNMRGIPKSIRDAMVLWYDLKKQKATNESMAANPILKDLSGNGNNATCYNFAWSGMSGIGGYNVDFSTFTGKYGTINGNVVTIDTTNSDITDWLWTSQIDYNGSPFKVNCTFIKVDPNPNNYVLIFQRPGGTNRYLCSEGYNEVPAISGDKGSKLQFSTFGKVKIIIEFIPEYPNALVSDGVDDYAIVQNKYAVDFTYKNEYNSLWVINNSKATGIIEKSKITLTSIFNISIQAYYQCSSSQTAFTIPKTKVKITGLIDGQTISYYDSANSFEDILIDSDGIYELPTFESNGKGMYYGFRCNKLQDTCNITIEQLPINKSLVLNKEDGYTVIAKRERLKDIGCLVSKRNSGNTDGAFVFELNTRIGNRCDSFNAAQYISYNNDIITWQTSKKYNGIALNIGNAQDTDALNLFMLYNNYYIQVVLYSLLLFNRDLTDDEIDWVKYNLL